MKTYLTTLIIFTATLSFGQLVPNNLLLHLPFSGNANDVSSFNRHGTVHGATLTTDRFGTPNSAYLFDGVNDFISIGSDNYSIIDEVSISVWVKTNSPSYQWITGKYMWQEDAGFHLTTSNSELILAGRDGNSVYNEVNSNTTIANNTWRHVVGAIDGNIWKLWIDGVLVQTYNTQHNNVDLRSTADLEIGRYFYTNVQYFDGAIDDYRMYDRMLTDAEVYLLYHESFCHSTVYDTVTVFDTVVIYDTISIGDSGDPTNISETNNTDNSISIYPNPTNGDFTIEMIGDKQKFTQFEVYDTKGSLVLSKKINTILTTIYSNEISAKGIYYIRFFANDRKYQLVKKLIID